MKKLTKAIKILQEELSKDKSEGSFYHSWQANIAMQFKDLIEYTGEVEGGWADGSDPKVAILTPKKAHELANQAAKNFLDLLIKL